MAGQSVTYSMNKLQTNTFTQFYQLRDRMWHPQPLTCVLQFFTHFSLKNSHFFTLNITIQNINKLWKTRIRCHIKSLNWRWFAAFTVTFKSVAIVCTHLDTISFMEMSIGLITWWNRREKIDAIFCVCLFDRNNVLLCCTSRMLCELKSMKNRKCAAHIQQP